MEPLAVDLRMLTEAGGPGLRLLPGRALMARVMQADGHGRGVLNIAGAVIEAELPAHVRAGEELRLVVRQLAEHRVVLELPSAPGAPTPDALPALPVPLPGGGALRVEREAEDESSGHSGDRGTPSSSLSLRYDAPSLGRLDLRFELDAGVLRVAVGAAPGTAHAVAAEHADELTRALQALSERAVTVTVTPRREPIDFYA